jgi:hypothetical protein
MRSSENSYLPGTSVNKGHYKRAEVDTLGPLEGGGYGVQVATVVNLLHLAGETVCVHTNRFAFASV